MLTNKTNKIKDWLKEVEGELDGFQIYRGSIAVHDLVDKQKTLFITSIVLKNVIRILEE